MRLLIWSLVLLAIAADREENQPAKAEQDNAVEPAKPEKDDALKATTPQDRQRRFSRLAFLIGRKVYRKGYSKGRRDGFRSGYSKGLKRGIHRGYYNGRKVGYAKGRSSGYRSGYHAGSARKYLRVLRKISAAYKRAYKRGYKYGTLIGYRAGIKRGHRSRHGQKRCKFIRVNGKYLSGYPKPFGKRRYRNLELAQNLCKKTKDCGGVIWSKAGHRTWRYELRRGKILKHSPSHEISFLKHCY